MEQNEINKFDKEDLFNPDNEQKKTDEQRQNGVFITPYDLMLSIQKAILRNKKGLPANAKI
ncbi:MAG TPA: hypothetical protein VMR49_01725 [Candidatus Paceibacterota bacterium]|nr:hypothetical protein [Candidatus Paceibacterota bacterium]